MDLLVGCNTKHSQQRQAQQCHVGQPTSRCHLKQRQGTHPEIFLTPIWATCKANERALICACHPCTRRLATRFFSVSFQLPKAYHLSMGVMPEVWHFQIYSCQLLCGHHAKIVRGHPCFLANFATKLRCRIANCFVQLSTWWQPNALFTLSRIRAIVLRQSSSGVRTQHTIDRNICLCATSRRVSSDCVNGIVRRPKRIVGEMIESNNRKRSLMEMCLFVRTCL